MKTTYSVEISQNSYDDDLFNGTYDECLEYIKSNGYTAEDNDVRIARILIDNDNTVAECLEIIPPAEFTDNTALITSAIHDMRAAYSRFMELVVKCGGIDPENAQNFAGFVTLINNTRC